MLLYISTYHLQESAFLFAFVFFLIFSELQYLKATIDNVAGKGALDVEYDMLRLQQGGNVEAFELLVGNGGNGCVELLFGQLVNDVDAVLVLSDGGIGPRVIDCDVDVVVL